MALNIYSLATDRDLEIDGVWHDWRGARVKLARSGNKEYQTFMSIEYLKMRSILESDNKEKANKAAAEIDKQAFIRHILKGWEGFEDPNGKEIKFNLRNASKIYDLVPDMEKELRILSANAENYRLEKLEEDKEALKK